MQSCIQNSWNQLIELHGMSAKDTLKQQSLLRSHLFILFDVVASKLPSKAGTGIFFFDINNASISSFKARA